MAKIGIKKRKIKQTKKDGQDQREDMRLYGALWSSRLLGSISHKDLNCKED